MATQVLTQLQTGSLSAGVWLTTGVPVLSSASEAWVQFDATPLVAEVPSALSILFSPLFNETGTLTVLYHDFPVLTDFSSLNLPVGITVNSFEVTFEAGVGGTTLPIELFDANGKATTFGAKLRATRRADDASLYRAAIGLQWSGTGGNGAFTSLTLTFTPDFGGDSRLVAPAGTDRAVQCPRCGTAQLESNLMRDGVLVGLYVCSDCYDPPKEPDTFRWPFRG